MLSLIFGVVMLAGIVTSFILFMNLISTRNDLSEKNKINSTLNHELDSINTELNLMIAAKAIADSIRNAELLSLVPVQQAAAAEEIMKKSENANFNIGINYKSSAKTTFETSKKFLEDHGYSIYYDKIDNRPSSNIIIYYSENSKSKAESLAEELSSNTEQSFTSTKGLNPGSITNSQVSKTLLIHIAN